MVCPLPGLVYAKELKKVKKDKKDEKDEKDEKGEKDEKDEKDKKDEKDEKDKKEKVSFENKLFIKTIYLHKTIYKLVDICLIKLL